MEYRVNIGEFIDALKQNGYPWGRLDMFIDNGEGTACAMGQAVLNIQGVTLSEVLSDRDLWSTLSDYAYKLDYALWDKYLRESTKITHYNDSAETYEDVVAWVEEKLGPHRNETITFEANQDEDED